MVEDTAEFYDITSSGADRDFHGEELGGFRTWAPAEFHRLLDVPRP